MRSEELTICMKVIEIHNIAKNFGKIQALDNISLEIDKAEIFGLIGPDGAGKTTLFRIIVTVLLPSSGEAKICGYDVVKSYREIRNLVGYMSGRFSLYHDLTVEENLKFYATVFGTTIEENYDLIQRYLQADRTVSQKKGRQSVGRDETKARTVMCTYPPA